MSTGEILDEAMEECDKHDKCVNGCFFDKDDLDGHTYVIGSAIIPADELEIVVVKQGTVRFNAVNECRGDKFQLTFELKSDGPYQPAPLAVKNGRVYAVMKSGMNPRLTVARVSSKSKNIRFSFFVEGKLEKDSVTKSNQSRFTVNVTTTEIGDAERAEEDDVGDNVSCISVVADPIVWTRKSSVNDDDKEEDDENEDGAAADAELTYAHVSESSKKRIRFQRPNASGKPAKKNKAKGTKFDAFAAVAFMEIECNDVQGLTKVFSFAELEAAGVPATDLPGDASLRVKGKAEDDAIELTEDDDNDEVADALQAFVQSACDSVGEKWPAGVKRTVVTKAVEVFRAEGYDVDALRSEDFDADAWDELKRLLKMKEEIGSFRANQLIRQLKTASSSASGE
jgi:hypothetical protein